MATQAAKKPPQPPPKWYRQLRAAGVTGTNGKTSTSLFLTAALSRFCPPVVATTTVGIYRNLQRTEHPLSRAGMLTSMRESLVDGAKFTVMELTSEALARGFLNTFPVELGVFTNLSQDHLDAHKNPEHYLASKAQLFMSLPKGGSAVLNAADATFELLKEVLPDGVNLITYGDPARGPVPAETQLKVTETTVNWEGTTVALAEPAFGSHVRQIHTRAIGAVFGENALAAFAGAVAMGVPPEVGAQAIAEAPPPPGRFERVVAAPNVVVDYAHTPDALRRTVSAARELSPGRVIVVFGAGGERDQKKRPLMGAAAEHADIVILTSDNPRKEDPEAIAEQIRAGMSNPADVPFEPDRRLAIQKAIQLATEEDVVVIAGKGHEQIQITNQGQRSFSDVSVIHELTAT